MASLGKKLLFLSLLLALCAAASAFRIPDNHFKMLWECEGKCLQKQDERERSACLQTCQREFEEREKKEREERRGGGEEGSNPEDPFKRLRECEGRCLQKKDERERSECHQTCHREFEEKEKREKERGGGGEGSNPEDPFKRLRECEGRCLQKKDERERSECHQTCHREFEEKEKREKEKEKERGGGEEGSNPQDPVKKLRECEGKCVQKKDEREWSECHQRCQREFQESERKEKERGGGGRGYLNPRQKEGEKEEQSEKEQKREQKSEPYVFQDQHFSTKLQTDHGWIRILQRFNEKSELLRGIENFRVAISESNPHTFVVPNHWDADTVIFVVRGRGTISLIHKDKRESFSVRRGDVLRVQAGTTHYMVNHDKNEKLVIVKLIQPVSTPGLFEAFFGPGGQNPKSFFRAFSFQLLEAAFNTKRDRFEKVFQQQSEGVIIKASEEQIKALSRHEEGGIWPFGGESKGPFNLFKQRPIQSNQHGRLYKIDPSEWKDLRELDLGVGFSNLSRGSMTAPMYNSRATSIAVVVEGEGYLEIACPHLSSSGGQKEEQKGETRQQRQSTPGYQRVSSHLRRGTVFVVPAGHPFITVASQNENLQVVCFEVKGIDNDQFQLAGKKNIFNQFEKEAKELAFGVSEQEVDEVFKSQNEEFFVEGPRQQREGRAYA